MIHQAKSNPHLLDEDFLRAACVRDFCYWQIVLKNSAVYLGRRATDLALSAQARNQALMHNPVSACQALLITSSRNAPHGSNRACSRKSLASSARRSSRDLVCL